MSDLHRLRAEVFGRPLMVEPLYAQSFVGALVDRFSVDGMTLPDGQRLDNAALRRRAESQGPRQEKKIFKQTGSVAVIEVTGVIAHRFGFLNPISGAVGSDGIRAKLEAAEADPSIKGVLLDIDSPGGAVAGTFDLADRIASSKKHVWAVADEMAASAGYALAAAADRIVLPRTASVGSVGVVMMHENRGEQMAQRGIEVSLVSAGKHKTDGHPFAALPAGVRERLQSEIDRTYAMFVESIARYRGISTAAVRATEARMYSGADAVSAGLADKVMPANDVLGAFRRHIAAGGARPARTKRTAIRKPPETLGGMAAEYWGSDQSAQPLEDRRDVNVVDVHKRRANS